MNKFESPERDGDNDRSEFIESNNILEEALLYTEKVILSLKSSNIDKTQESIKVDESNG